jgi:hypothetical protein
MSNSLRNRVQLFGCVYRNPRNFTYLGEPYVRLLIEVDEVDNKGQQFSSYHPVIVPEKMANDELSGPVCIGDSVMVEGRLNNYLVRKTGKRGSNVQAFELLILQRAADKIKALVSSEVSEDVKEKLDVAYKAVVAGNVIPLRIVDYGDDELPF